MLMVMGNCTLRFFPSSIALQPSSNFLLHSTTSHFHFHLRASSSSNFLLHSTTPHLHFHLRASSSSSSSSSSTTTTTPATTTNNNTQIRRRRRSRRLKSDAEICHDIRQFLLSVGLPDHHVPSTKELLLHGRNELANIVRRRGHKQIGELLASSLHANIDSMNMENGFGERLDAADDLECLLTGQNVKVDSLVDGVAASTEVSLGSYSISLDPDSTVSLVEDTSICVESSANLTVDNGSDEPNDHAEEVNHLVEENLYPTEVAVGGNDDSSSREGFYGNFDNQCSVPTEISGELQFGTEYSENVECEDNVKGKMFGDITSPSLVPSMENDYNNSFNDSVLDTEDKVYSPLASSMDLTLEPKDRCALDGSNNNISENVPSTSEFSIMENLSGENKVDSVVPADSSSINVDSLANLSLEEKVANFIHNGDLDLGEDEDDSQESKVNFESEPVGDMTLNGSSSTSKHLVPSGTFDHHKDDKDLTTDFDKDLDDEVPKVQNQSEINYLKFMLYQKELELSRLKEQIEKEKHALSVLQTKAEAEINKARKLISEKDAELDDAEESLSGLKEVEVEFCGDGDVVEVAGSFNGWHHRIKMDPQPSTSTIDFGGSRRSKFWSTTLWLYPGVYEIKFVVDGHWRTDLQMESVTRGHICNNILRVDR